MSFPAAMRQRDDDRHRPGLSAPSFIIADEPTTALDVTIQAKIIDLIKDIQEKIRHRRDPDHP